MNEIWANRLIAETKRWEQLPDFRKDAVTVILSGRVKAGTITADTYKRITGQNYKS